MAFLSPTQATELTHRFQSPMNGGNALNGTYLLNQAIEQNNFKDPVANAAAAAAAAKAAAASTTTATQTNIENFKNTLQRAILSRLSDTSSSKLFDDKGNILLGSDLNFDFNGDGSSDFAVVVDSAPTNGNVTIQISDGITSTSLTVPYIAPTP
jgi:hypothetical protein